MFQPGLYTALITPFTQGGSSVDVPSFRKLLMQQLEAKVSGVVLFGSTGESPTISIEEREVLLSLAMKDAGHLITVMAGISTNDLQTALKMARQAKRLNVHGIQIATPSYNKPTQEGLYQFYKAIGEEAELPLFLYNIPSRSVVHIEKHTMKKLFSLPFVRGIKEASGSMTTLYDVLDAAKHLSKDFLILAGDDMLAIPSIASGAQGIMSVVSNLIPRTMKKCVEDVLQGDLPSARSLFFQIKPLIEACFIETNPSPIKYFCHLRATIDDPCLRLPLVEPTSNNKVALLTTYKHFESLA